MTEGSHEAPGELEFVAVAEAAPGPGWLSLFDERWPAYERWYGSDAEEAARPTFLACERALRELMPAMVPVWEALVDVAGGGDLRARFLSLYRPPRAVRACSQAVLCGEDGPALVRNYDYSPALCDGVILRSEWSGVPVVATTDCMVGALDGMNGHGLAGALAFGGRPVHGDGFAASMALRYVLETCATTSEAVAALRRLPIYMAYTYTLVDRRGETATVHAAPDRKIIVTADPVSTNHQRRVEWPEYAKATDSVGRAERLRSMIAAGGDLDRFVARFLDPPLYRLDHERGFGTLYTVAYRPLDGSVEHRWPGRRWDNRLDAFEPRTVTVTYPRRPRTAG